MSADAAAVNPNGIKGPLANDLSTFFINGNSIFNNGPRSLTRNSPNCTILISFNNNLCGNLVFS